MGIINFQQLKAVPDYIWEQLCTEVKPLVELAQELQITLCNNYGEVIYDQINELFIYCDNYQSRAICFNGDLSKNLDCEVFTLTQSLTNKYQWCRTDDKPYDWLVRAILIVASSHYPSYWLVDSVNDKAVWQQVKADIAYYLGINYDLPIAC